MSKAYDKVMAGLEDARGYLSGARRSFRKTSIARRSRYGRGLRQDSIYSNR